MKPRLKLSTNGKLTLLTEGVSGLKAHQVKQLIRGSHGSLAAFARKHQVNYSGLICSFMPRAEWYAGQAYEIRRLLGLPSNPSKANIALATAQAKRRSTRKGASA